MLKAQDIFPISENRVDRDMGTIQIKKHALIYLHTIAIVYPGPSLGAVQKLHAELELVHNLSMLN